MKDKHTLMDSVMEQIEKKEVIPKPRWEFLLKNYSMWAVGGIALLLGAVATSSALFVLRNGDWFLLQRLSGSLLGHSVSVIPFLWIVLLIIFILLAMYQMKHTQRGYRYSFAIIVGNVIASILLGIVMYVFGLGYVADTFVGRVLPLYSPFEERREQMWTQPENGLLSGTVLGTSSDSMYEMQDFLGKVWSISTDKIDSVDIFILNQADEVGIIGNKIGTSTFEACAVRPWNIEGVHEKLRERMQDEMMQRGLLDKQPAHIESARSIIKSQDELSAKNPPMQGFERGHGQGFIKEQLLMKGYGERNISELRSIECESDMETLSQ